MFQHVTRRRENKQESISLTRVEENSCSQCLKLQTCLSLAQWFSTWEAFVLQVTFNNVLRF